MYGAGDAKLARILGCSVPQARKAKKDFLNNLPAMKKLKAAIEKTVKERGFLRSLDGQPLKVRSMHSALNTLLQSAGAIVMKKALVLLDETLQVRGLVPGLHYEFILNVHDEYSLEVMDVEGLPELVAKEATKAITRAGEHFNFRCPLTGEAKIGKTWLDVH